MLTVIARVEVTVLRILSFGLGFQWLLWELLCTAIMSSSTTPRRPGCLHELESAARDLERVAVPHLTIAPARPGAPPLAGGRPLLMGALSGAVPPRASIGLQQRECRHRRQAVRLGLGIAAAPSPLSVRADAEVLWRAQPSCPCVPGSTAG